MKTRNSPKLAPGKKPPPKKTPPKPSTEATTPHSAATTPSPTVQADASTPKTTVTPTAPKQQKTGAPTTATAASAAAAKPTTAPKVASKPKVEDASASGAADKKVPGKKVMRVVKKKIVKPKSPPVEAAKSDEVGVVNVEEVPKKEEQVSDSVDESLRKEELDVVKIDESLTEKESVVENVELENKVEKKPVVEKEEEQGGDGDEALDKVEEDVEEGEKGKDVQVARGEDHVDEAMEDGGEQEGFQVPGDEECAEDDILLEPEEDDKKAEEEHKEISAHAQERKSKKEQEIFVGGLDRDTVEDDIWKAFESIGEVVEVRLHRNQTTNKNKGYAFVKFATKELAKKALSELKNPLIRGKRCGVAPSEDNDSLFVGNICNTWTKEAIKKKLKEYGVEGVENITLVSDPQHEGLSRGFAFVGFSCHADAMLAYKRLQKPDVVFGHAERTVKVAFAEPLREPDPEIMAQVKSVFIDGLPPYWDEERVRDHFKPYGEVERIVLARNMQSAKRKDFGFVDFNTHEAAIACIEGVNNTDLGDGKSKSKVKVRLSNPLPKTQAVKGGLCGGFRIGRPDSGFSRFGRGFGQSGRPVKRTNFQRGKDSHARGRDRTGKIAFAREDISEGPYSGSRGRRPFNARGGFGGRRGYDGEFSSRAATSSRPDFARSSYGPIERGRAKSTLPREQLFSEEGPFSRPVVGRRYVEDPYMYDDGGYGLKRPYSMLDHEPGYLEPRRLRPRFEHPDPIVSSHEPRYQDSMGAGRGLRSPDYYSSAYGGGAYSSTYGGDRSYGGGYYY